MRPYQFCNLSEVVVRATDTEENLIEKVRLATILGTFQSTLNYFPYLRDIWRKNTEEERLLGVSLTGIYDSVITSGKAGHLPEVLAILKTVAIETNREIAEDLDIPVSAAITCVKPSGTVSQLVDAASGIHPRHSDFYIRRVRGDIKDPLSAFMASQGVPNEPCVNKPDQTMVFSFAKRTPEGGVTRDNVSALEHLDLWLTYQKHWCEHKPSTTINVKEHEWPEVGAFVWKHFDIISGVSFLPYDGGSYRQAPYEECSEEDFKLLALKMPNNLNWDSISENTDTTEGAQSLACTGNVCEIVDSSR